jgi:hypothetical protein
MPKPKRKDKTVQQAPGFDGHVLVNAHVQLSTQRTEPRTIRCRPGSFEWSYGTRKQHGTLYHAGVHFSGLWERAHITVASPNLTPSVATQWRGLPDSRAEALSEIKRLGQHIGTYAMSRLIDYCILGNTTEEIGCKYRMNRKAMHHVLQCDLTDVASHFRFVG